MLNILVSGWRKKVVGSGSRPILRFSLVEKPLEVGSKEGDNEEIG